MQVTVLGCGDAFGSGGRFNTCFHLRGASASILVDCGATSHVALQKAGISTDLIDGVVVSHLHGDHFGGLPFLLLDACFMRKRVRPFFVLRPAGIGARLERASEALFPGLAAMAFPFSFEVLELVASTRTEHGGIAITPFPAAHTAGPEPCFSLRVEIDGRVVTYSGDTAWTDTLIEAARDADLFLCESSSYERATKGHMAFAELKERLPRIAAKRVVLTHLNPDMLERQDALGVACAADGMTIVL